MEPGPYLEIINFAGPPICKYWNYHRKLKEGLNILRSKKETLNARYEDTRLRLRNELCHFGKQPKQEVENWLKKVEKIIGEIQSLEDEVGKVRYLSRAFLGKRVYKKIEETTEVYGEGSFSESLVIDDPSNSGMALSTPELVSEAAVKEKIWQYLMGDSLCKIGVCGMGGIGKTTIMKHIHNELLREAKFDKVIWVTVSQECDVFKLQEKIASALGEDLSKHEDEAIRVTVLSKILESRKRHVLILDDVWKRFFLPDVGIPEPSISNGCKLVLTTRSIELALSMGCEAIRVTPLSEGDALNLFLNHAGQDVYVPALKPTLEQVVEQCAGLPLAIILIGSSMRGEYDVRMWKNALNNLKKHAGSADGMADEVFQRLKFSYDRLPSEKLKHCFLYCALYPEDFEISRDQLIEYWIVEGLIEEMETRQEMYDAGLFILKRLKNNCLLESAKNVGYVKMHDVVRDLALHITNTESPRYLVKAGMQLEELPNEQEWKEDVEKVSLMENRIKEISSDVAIPKCRRISTFLLQNNHSLERIHETFFLLMTGLTILDLSNSNIKALPNSVSELQNLKALLLTLCYSLEYVPSLSKLRGLKKLDLGYTNIKEVPHGMEMLVNLRYLNLDSNGLREVPAGILPKLSRLQYLRLNRTPGVIVEEEVAGLRKLETLHIQFNNHEDYRLYLSRLQPGCLNSYYFHVGSDFAGFIRFYSYGKCVGFYRLSVDSIILRTDIQAVFFEDCDDITSLSDRNSSFKDAIDLRYLMISFCRGIECLVSSSSCYNILQSIEKLELSDLGNFSVLFRGERDRSAASTPTPPGMFSHLKHIEIQGCPKIDKLFWPELVHNLQNLEEIQVKYCEQLAEIISTSDDDEENKEEGRDFNIFTLPKLRKMTFWDLPQIKCICNFGSRMECNSLEKIKIGDCPKLKRIPLLLPQPDNGQLLPPVSLGKIKINSKEWWDSLEWDHPNIKNVLEPSLRVVQIEPFFRLRH